MLWYTLKNSRLTSFWYPWWKQPSIICFSDLSSAILPNTRGRLGTSFHVACLVMHDFICSNFFICSNIFFLFAATFLFPATSFSYLQQHFFFICSNIVYLYRVQCLIAVDLFYVLTLVGHLKKSKRLDRGAGPPWMERYWVPPHPPRYYLNTLKNFSSAYNVKKMEDRSIIPNYH